MSNLLIAGLTYFFLPALVVIVAFAVWRRLYIHRSREWASSPFAADRLMRRWVGGKWEYRPMTEEEGLDELETRVW